MVASRGFVHTTYTKEQVAFLYSIRIGFFRLNVTFDPLDERTNVL